MGVAKKTRKFALTKRVIGSRDARVKANQEKARKNAVKSKDKEDIKHIPQQPMQLFFSANTALGPPYSILADTNFFAHTVRGKLDLLLGLMDLLFAKCNICVTDCVLAELEKLGPRYRLALKLARNEKWERLPCDHKGVYADDCIVERVMENRIYLVGTDDKNLKIRLRKIPGCPLISVARGKYVIEKLPEVI